MKLKELRQYRQLALNRFEQLLIGLPSDPPHEADYFCDRQIRMLSKLPSRPDNSLPYRGLYGDQLTMDKYRDLATDRLESLLLDLDELKPIDEEIDESIRLLADLPERPENREPYVGLFVLPPDRVQDDIEEESVLTQGQDLVTAEQVIQILGGGQVNTARKLTPGINETFTKYQIDTPLRMAHFLAQVMHESGGFQWLREIWGPTPDQKSYELPHRKARELGNTKAGDGSRFRGRGLIQLTGRANYKQFSDALGIDFISHPEKVEIAPYAVLAAGWYWNTRKINEPADQDDVVEVTKRINGGTNGIADRRKYLKRAKLILGA